ncbi:Peptidase_C39 like family protein [Actinokineospora alba]|uniref:Peptidase_C39 like family protein n=1 Tax=Actinokineospora alba TaxID=504798 RepID=A0A1H0HPV9_9PSEU|nr:C39 family peptidase [Actinokineospora alba]TDP64813.1 peptidase C39-like protein [Actinokineospora alba]SDH46558.1 Peptidase_C39 like family protein [Actinokineospora alba]SDO20841.1 Peptidase_C39 like family protein [Actinokineospora alba]
MKSKILRAATAIAVSLGTITGVTVATAPAASACVIIDGQCMPNYQTSKTLWAERQGQHTSYFCGPAATRIAITARGLYPSQEGLAGLMGTHSGGTDSSWNIRAALNKTLNTTYYDAKFGRDHSTSGWANLLRSDILFDINRGWALVVNVSGGASTTSGWRSYPGGHYIAVLGYDQSGDRARVVDTGYNGGLYDPQGYYYGEYWINTTELARWSYYRGYAA